MAMNLVSIAYYRLGGKDSYYIKLMQETLRVYVGMMTFGNRMIQERMINLYKEGLKHFDQIQ